MLSPELKLQSLQTIVDRAVLDPAAWVDVCDAVADFLGGVGTVIFPEQLDLQLPGIAVWSPSLDGLMTDSFRDGWVNRTYRNRSIPIIKLRGFATDRDISDEHVRATEPYYTEFLASHKLGDFVGLGLVSTTQLFIAAVQRPLSAPPPDDDVFRRVALARPILSAGARASVAVGSLRFESWKDMAAGAAGTVFVLDHLGRVIDRSDGTEPLLGSVFELVHAHLHLRVEREDEQLGRLIAAACAPDRQVALPRPVFTKEGLMLEAVRLPASLRYFHSRAAALLVVRPVADNPTSLADLLRQRTGLTAAEVKVALALFEGQSLAEYAQHAGLSTGTARQQIKSVFRKTGTGRQNELSALIRRLNESVSK